MIRTAKRTELIEVAQGRRPADIVIQGGTVANVYSGEFLRQNVAIYQDAIAYVGENEVAVDEHTVVIDAEGMYVSPGFIEPHAHPWVLYNPVSVTAKVLPLGTTTTVNDNLFFYLHFGADGFRQLIEDLRALPGHFFWLVRLVSQADFPGERDWFHPQCIQELLAMDDVVGTAEVTRWPLLYQGDPFLLETIEAAKRAGKVVDGHTAGCSYEKLNSIAASGVSACHEAITAEEALHRLRLGMWTTLRHSSLRPDFPEIIRLITEKNVSTQRITMTVDGPHPGFIEREGFVDGLVRKAVELGVPPMTALQMATINAATYLRLDDEIGGIAPGKLADVILLPDLVTFKPSLVIAKGRIVARDGELLAPLPEIDWSRYVSKKPFLFAKERLDDERLYRYPHPKPDQPVPVAYFKSNVITQRKEVALPSVDGYADLSHHRGLLYAALIARNGQWVAKAILERFAVDIDGMASTYNTTTELLVIGKRPEAMAAAAKRVHEMGGGIVVIDSGRPVVEIPLPFTGMMTTDHSFDTAVRFHDELLAALQERGFPFHDILYTLLFLTCDFLPGLRLIPYGLYDVKRNEILLPAEKIGEKVAK
ncbi:adenosine deaminase [Geobacillus subterraneus]|uniref:adenine deaminase n=2 Tax=Geobacillus TaxID=129337 RepID=A0ABN4NKE8_9BACL|nr:MULTISPECIES: adenine deaminase C-terminal domain-containing protein [Geobacillus]AMX83390.1 adenosine deaminase [Geobacillus subterraneus]KZS24242.1 adenosine deaminase [Geobacillus subterraneus]OXB90415.1 adenosine deaminase [Geobacillus uzenensis]QIZ67989.1 adenine deaminase [Geobacillus subterraneus]WPZ16993.1 adenine deaminase C-terminal domain-containing protein [Geobacillus subterraneus]